MVDLTSNPQLAHAALKPKTTRGKPQNLSRNLIEGLGLRVKGLGFGVQGDTVTGDRVSE